MKPCIDAYNMIDTREALMQKCPSYPDQIQISFFRWCVPISQNYFLFILDEYNKLFHDSKYEFALHWLIG